MARKLVVALAAVALIAAAFAGVARARSLRALVAPGSVCAHQVDLGDSAAVQERAMRCMTNFARRHADRRDLGDAADLDRSARRKADDILRCDSFSHYACGRRFTYWMRRDGYLATRCWRAGENIAWGTGTAGTVRAIFVAWLRSPEHRANLLGRYAQIGIALRVGDLEGHRRAHVWTQDFGSHCGLGAIRHPLRPTKPRIALRIARVAH